MGQPLNCDRPESGVLPAGLPCRLLPTQIGDGPGQMALDDVLLEQAAEQGVATLRFYMWEHPTLSLGYFQPSAPALAAYPDIPWVRRPSGGAALLHHIELTYALALPPGRDWQPAQGLNWICRMHHIIRQTLEAFGVRGTLCSQEEKKGDILCFLHHTPGDLIVAGHKVVGSAQRKLRGALLQHGGILLMSSHHTPELPGIVDLGGPPRLFDELAPALRAAFHAATSWDLQPGTLSEAERQRITEIRAQRYENEEWNRRR